MGSQHSAFGVDGTSLDAGSGGVTQYTGGCTSNDHTKAIVSSFHLGGALTWSF
jgi:hypothetical protein